jgi:hypothetical protein
MGMGFILKYHAKQNFRMWKLNFLGNIVEMLRIIFQPNGHFIFVSKYLLIINSPPRSSGKIYRGIPW